MKSAAIALLLSCSLAQAADPAQAIDALERRIVAQRRLLNDWAGLTRYGSENAEIRPPAAGENRVVFLGDDITERWGTFFPGKPYLNRGIGGQTSGQMLVRFRQDVVALKPKVVVIQAGVSDLAGAMGPMTQAMTMENLMSMTDLARANGILVVLASLTPAALLPPGKIIGLNGAIKDHAAASGAVYLDYYAALVDGRDFKKEFTSDGLIPNEAGYRVMAPLAESAIARALGGK